MDRVCSVSDCDRVRRARGLCSMHHRRWKDGREVEAPVRIVGDHTRRFFTKVDRRADWDCWLWNEGLKDGYGVFYVGRIANVAHRWAYEAFVGPIPEDYEVDHLCRVRACVNPYHLEAVTGAENRRRAKAAQTECKHGHPLSGDNLIFDSHSGARRCRECRRVQARRRRKAS